MPTFPLTIAIALPLMLAPIGQAGHATFRVEMSNASIGPYSNDQVKAAIERKWTSPGSLRRSAPTPSTSASRVQRLGALFDDDLADRQGLGGADRGRISLRLRRVLREKVLYKLTFPPAAERKASLVGLTLHANE